MDFEQIRNFAHPMGYILIMGMHFMAVMYLVDILIDLQVKRDWKWRWLQ